MPEQVEQCVQSVLDDNPEYSKSRAYAICNAMQNKGELGDVDTHDELLHAQAELTDDCDNGYVKANGECVKVETVTDTPPGVLNMSEPNVYALSDLATKPIKRVESGDTVRYQSVRLLGPGVWTDNKSRETIWYSPSGIENLSVEADNTLNLMHDEDNSVSDIGHIDPESVQTDDKGYLYGDLVLHMDNSASEYADDNLQETLESEGAKGFGGPSVEIANKPDDVEYNSEKGMQELVGGNLTGAALVSNPASKNVAFSTQSAQRGVALASDQSDKAVYTQRSLMDPDQAREVLDKYGFEGLDEMDDDEVMGMVEDLKEDLGESEGEGEDGQDMEDGEDDDEMPDDEGEDDDPEDEDMDMEAEEMAQKIQSMDERLQNVEDMVEQAMAAEDVSEELEDLQSDLADAETVSELADAIEEHDKRLSSVEDEPKDPRSLSDGAEVDDDTEPEGTVTMARNFDSRSGTISR